MLTLEICTRSRSDPYYMKSITDTTNELFSNFLFRWTRKGKPLAPFPGCEDEMEYTKSSLCRLSILMEAFKDGENIKDFEKTCKKITDEYYDGNKSKNVMKDIMNAVGCVNEVDDTSMIPFLW